MKSPRDALVWAQRRYTNQRQRWLDGEGDWPLQVSLDRPGEREAFKQGQAVRDWSEEWHRWQSPAGTRLVLETVAYRSLGEQNLPTRLEWDSPADLAAFVGDVRNWQRAVERRRMLLARWPSLGAVGFGPRFSVLSAEADSEFERLFSLLDWFDKNPRSGLYLRQLPVAGLDTKWVDRHRRRVVSDLLRRIRGTPEELGGDDSAKDATDEEADLVEAVGAEDFHMLCGLRKPAPRIRLLVLCPKLRCHTAGLRDIEAAVDSLAALELAPRRVVVIENLETSYSLPDIDGAVALVKLGNAVGLAANLPWLQGIPVVYWGDIDTHGFAILAQARRSLGQVTSVLMDEETIVRYRDRGVVEPVQTRGAVATWLTLEEQHVYEGLLSGRWGQSLRIEQERIEWPIALAALQRGLQGC